METASHNGLDTEVYDLRPADYTTTTTTDYTTTTTFDFQKAFDKVPHARLLNKLLAHRLRGDLIEVFKMFKGFDNITLKR